MAQSKKWMKNAGKKAKGKADDKGDAKGKSDAAKKPRGERWYDKKKD